VGKITGYLYFIGGDVRLIKALPLHALEETTLSCISVPTKDNLHWMGRQRVIFAACMGLIILIFTARGYRGLIIFTRRVNQDFNPTRNQPAWSHNINH